MGLWFCTSKASCNNIICNIVKRNGIIFISTFIKDRKKKKEIPSLDLILKCLMCILLLFLQQPGYGDAGGLYALQPLGSGAGSFALKKQMLDDRRFSKMHLNLQRLLQLC
ncbi:uncharacterized protein LOC131253617 [Magnolia sinica]|uniref:uncharacterized protein LOC131253617 n=1 Tax=Magnolia sinica TaxID=86752 RepID=UPI002657F5AA|nr:uncharacterized protein LOC131253617 [Magnolia sinica]